MVCVVKSKILRKSTSLKLFKNGHYLTHMESSLKTYNPESQDDNCPQLHSPSLLCFAPSLLSKWP
ncbi:hypothetical protein HYC85_028882 [Camellia sinensis]|uniref:Uncharacterized protein n=1 Tax=Camellia sinensis TaxID=4442 RepID=A0A7J7FXK6_CAMSI|nr:hypothetical protein HYC85_028882 [Camellia sinensis]